MLRACQMSEIINKKIKSYIELERVVKTTRGTKSFQPAFCLSVCACCPRDKPLVESRSYRGLFFFPAESFTHRNGLSWGSQSVQIRPESGDLAKTRRCHLESERSLCERGRWGHSSALPFFFSLFMRFFYFVHLWDLFFFLNFFKTSFKLQRSAGEEQHWWSELDIRGWETWKNPISQTNLEKKEFAKV